MATPLDEEIGRWLVGLSGTSTATPLARDTWTERARYARIIRANLRLHETRILQDAHNKAGPARVGIARVSVDRVGS